MNEDEAKILKTQLKEAFKIGIERVGINNFKKISWFGSNKVQDRLEDVDLLGIDRVIMRQ